MVSGTSGGIAALGSCDGECAFSHVVLGLTPAFPARGKLPLPDPHQAEAEPGLLPAVRGGDAAGARRVDGSRGVALPRLPRDLLQQLLLHRQAAGNQDVQAGGCLARAGTAAPGPAAGGRSWPLLACCFFSSLPQTASRNVLHQHFVEFGVVILQYCCCLQNEPRACPVLVASSRVPWLRLGALAGWVLLFPRQEKR